MQQRIRSTVVPVLEGRADALGLVPDQRALETTDPLELALSLGEGILHAEERQALPFSDTVELTAGALTASAPTSPHEPGPGGSEHERDSIE